MKRMLELIDFKDSALSSDSLNSIKGMTGETNDYCEETISTGDGYDTQSKLYKDGELRCTKLVIQEC